MKHFLKGAAVVVGIIVVNMIINIISNMNGIDLNSTASSTASAIAGMWIYNGLIMNEKDKEDRK